MVTIWAAKFYCKAAMNMLLQHTLLEYQQKGHSLHICGIWPPAGAGKPTWECRKRVKLGEKGGMGWESGRRGWIQWQWHAPDLILLFYNLSTCFLSLGLVIAKNVVHV